MKNSFHLLIIFVIGIPGGTLIQAEDTDILDQIQQRYQTISSFQGKFAAKQLYRPKTETTSSIWCGHLCPSWEDALELS